MWYHRLRDRLVRIITDYRTETSLRHGCNDILKVRSLYNNFITFFLSHFLINQQHFLIAYNWQADCVNLLVKYFKEAKHGIYLGSIEEETNTKEKIRNTNDYQMIETDRPQRTMELKSKTRGGGRCCLCLDSFSIQNVSVIVFFCCHSYHVSCLISSSDSANSGSNDGESYDNDDDKDDIQSDKPRLRCVLCTTAVGWGVIFFLIIFFVVYRLMCVLFPNQCKLCMCGWVNEFSNLYLICTLFFIKMCLITALYH